ncbi:hypothetical protein B0A55_09439 [Friedmanniomyces simplex]|uniref:Uncharacterized protein n=1 Tax=Friedmanniomyces simplex TaxID=329884 RepID=A0A4V5NE06_9PEZI|nr:hypothetical protein B0A55_09439 [Friedmanniomyces simplex]
MSNKVILYDLANKKNASWSPNPWKTRVVLNFKKIPYETEWVEYPDLAPKFKALGIPPNPPGSFADFSSPTVRLTDGNYVMDSMPIAEKLEAAYPEPSMHLDNGLWKQAAEICDGLVVSAGPDFMVAVVDDILQEPSKTWFAEDRHKRFGMSLQELQEKMGGETGRPATQAGCEKLKGLLTSHKEDEGPFILGSKPSYGDLLAATLFESMRRMNVSQYEKIVESDESFKRLHEACKPWLERDN